MISGRYLDLADPRPEQFQFADVAGALAKICRFGAQCPYFYSVAEHSVICAAVANCDLAPLECQRAVLLHDAAEAFLGDVVKPLKIMLPEYHAIEKRMERVIQEKFSVDFEQWDREIKEIDHAVLIAERYALFGRDGVEWSGENEVRRLDVRPARWSWAQAQVKFAEKAQSLGIKIITG